MSPQRWRPAPHVRPVAIGVARRDETILVFEGRDGSKGETFFRPLGGTIEFGESGEDALRREFREELGAELRSARYLGALENLYMFEGEPGHEIVLVYEAELADRAMYERPLLEGRFDGGTTFHVLWKPLAELDQGATPLYPDGLLELLRRGA